MVEVQSQILIQVVHLLNLKQLKNTSYKKFSLLIYFKGCIIYSPYFLTLNIGLDKNIKGMNSKNKYLHLILKYSIISM